MAAIHKPLSLVIVTELLVLFSGENATLSPASSPEKKLAMRIGKKGSFGVILAMKKVTVDSSLLCSTDFFIIIRAF